MLVFCVLNKQEKDIWLPRMFELFYGNIHPIAPSGLDYEQEYAQWLENVSPALEKAPRQVILCLADGGLAGFLQYYTNGKLLMIEELQIQKAYQNTTLFLGFCRYLLGLIPAEVEYIEAYAHQGNARSQRLMQRLGMEQLEVDGPFVHLRGSARKAKAFFK